MPDYWVTDPSVDRLGTPNLMTRTETLSFEKLSRACFRRISEASWPFLHRLIRSTASWSSATSQSCEKGVRSGSARRSQKRLTPSQAMIKNSSSSLRSVSVVYGLPTTNSFIEVSPRLRVTARTPKGKSQ